MENMPALLDMINNHNNINIDKKIYMSGLNKKIGESKSVVLCGGNEETVFLADYISKCFKKEILQIDKLEDLDDKYKKEAILIVGDAKYQWNQYKQSQEIMCDNAYIVDSILKELISDCVG